MKSPNLLSALAVLMVMTLPLKAQFTTYEEKLDSIYTFSASNAAREGYEFFYDQNQQLDSTCLIEYAQRSWGTAYLFKGGTSYKYNSSGKLSEQTDYWGSIPDARKRAAYDTQGRLDSFFDYDYRFGWKLARLSYNIYNGQGQLNSQISYYRNIVAQKWRDTLVMHYYYFADGDSTWYEEDFFQGVRLVHGTRTWQNSDGQPVRQRSWTYLDTAAPEADRILTWHYDAQKRLKTQYHFWTDSTGSIADTAGFITRSYPSPDIWTDSIFTQMPWGWEFSYLRTYFKNSIGLTEHQLPLFDVFPNPASDVISWQHDLGTQVISAEIIDASGHPVKEIKAPRKEIGVAELPSGPYILRLNTFDGSFVQKILIKH